MAFSDEVQFDEQGLVTVITVDAATRDVLMVAYMNREALERTAITCAWVYSDVQLLANILSETPFGVLRRQGEEMEDIPSHPFEQLLEWPNKFMDQSWLLAYTALWFLLRGEAYWFQVPDRSGQLVEIWPIPASRMYPIPDPKKYIRGYAYKSTHDGQPQVFPCVTERGIVDALRDADEPECLARKGVRLLAHHPLAARLCARV